MNRLTELLVDVVLLLIAGWCVMLAIGVVHAHVLPSVLPCGFDDALLVTVLLTVARRALA